MFAGSAEGVLLAPYVVYKAENLWSTWTENGPPNTCYNRSKSGWFDTCTFEDWFQNHFLPAVRNEDGPVVLIGDNLSSHINIKVLELCQAKNILFVCLPPNATHIAQPLDVAFFSPMKLLWRGILTRWKESKSGSKYSTIPEEMFPELLRELVYKLEENGSENLKLGFQKCGIYPINKQKLLDRLPENQSNVNPELVGESFIERLEEKCIDFIGTAGTQRRRKLQVEPGKSITACDISTTNKTSTKRARRVSISFSSLSENADDIILESEGESETFSDLEECMQGGKTQTNCSSIKKVLNPSDFAQDEFVLVLYNAEKYPGKIVSISEDGPTIECMEKKLKCWKWPERKDVSQYSWEDILCKINPPKIMKRGQFLIPELQKFV